MTDPTHHRARPFLEAPVPNRPVAAAALAAVAVVAIYHIPGATVLADALRAACAGAACCLVLALAGHGATRPPNPAAQERWVLLTVAECAVFAALAGAVCTYGLGQQALLTLNPLVTLGVAGLALVALSSLGTALWEEVLFRHLAPLAVQTQLEPGPHAPLAAACACSCLFGLLHLGGAEAGAGQMAARFVQTALFGLVMAGVATRRHGLAWAVALHALYDAVSFACGASLALGTGEALATLPATELVALASSPAGIAASLVFLAPLAVWACKALGAPAKKPRTAA